MGGLQVQALGQVLKPDKAVCLGAGVTRMLLGGVELCSCSGCLGCLSSLRVTSFHVASLFAGRRARGEHSAGEREDGGVVAVAGFVARHPCLGGGHWNSSELLVILRHGGLLLHAHQGLVRCLLLRSQLGVCGGLLGASGGLPGGFAAVGGLARGGLGCGGLIGGLRCRGLVGD